MLLRTFISPSFLLAPPSGFTGTCVWVDPVQNLVFIFLSNRVNPDGGANKKLGEMNVRSNIQETIYQSIINKQY